MGDKLGLEATPPELAEIARTLSDFRHEMRGQLAQLVRTDVYRAEMALRDQRIAALEDDAKRSDADRAAKVRLTYGAIVAGVVSVMVAIIGIVLNTAQ